MDDYTRNLYINDPDTWIENYGKGGKYNSLREQQHEGNCQDCIKEKGPIKTTGNGKLKNQK